MRLILCTSFYLGFILASTNPRIQKTLHRDYRNVEQWCAAHRAAQEGANKFQLTPSDRLWLPTVTRIVKSFL